MKIEEVEIEVESEEPSLYDWDIEELIEIYKPTIHTSYKDYSTGYWSGESVDAIEEPKLYLPTTPNRTTAITAKQYEDNVPKEVLSLKREKPIFGYGYKITINNPPKQILQSENMQKD